MICRIDAPTAAQAAAAKAEAEEEEIENSKNKIIVSILWIGDRQFILYTCGGRGMLCPQGRHV